MPDPLKVQNGVVDLTLNTVTEIHDDSPAYRSLYEVMTAWATVGAMKQIWFIRDLSDPLEYAWRAERTDLTVLDSVFMFDDAEDLDPEITIALPIAWPLSVIQAGAGTRAQIIQIRADYGLISFTVDFL